MISPKPNLKIPSVFLNGTITTQASLNIADRGFLLGHGIFETFLTRKNQLNALAKHWLRLSHSAKLLNIPLLYTEKVIEHAITELLDLNAIQGNAAIRITLSGGPAARGLLPSDNSSPTLLITCEPYHHLEKKRYKVVYSTIKRNEASPLCWIKSTNYLEPILARMEAEKENADDAILCNTQGNITETTIANLFMVQKNQLLTPPVSDGALPGITRDTIIQIAKQHALPLKETCISKTLLESADEIFITNSLMGVQAITHLNENAFTRHDITKKIAQLYNETIT